jgi:hypothetical protein
MVKNHEHDKHETTLVIVDFIIQSYMIGVYFYSEGEWHDNIHTSTLINESTRWRTDKH